MNVSTVSLDDHRRRRKSHRGDKKRFTPRPMGYLWGLNEKYNINKAINQNLQLFRFSIYQGGILQVLLSSFNSNQKEFKSKRYLMKCLRNYFHRLEKPRKVNGKSIDSALFKLGHDGKIYGDLIHANTIYGKSVVMGYRITTPLTDQTKRQIDIFNKLVNHYAV